MQIEELNYLETFVATSIPSSQRMLLALAAANNQEIKQINFIGTFLNLNLKEAIYIEILDRFAKFAKHTTKSNNSKVLKLLKKYKYKPSLNQVILLQKFLYSLK